MANTENIDNSEKKVASIVKSALESIHNERMYYACKSIGDSPSDNELEEHNLLVDALKAYRTLGRVFRLYRKRGEILRNECLINSANNGLNLLAQVRDSKGVYNQLNQTLDECESTWKRIKPRPQKRRGPKEQLRVKERREILKDILAQAGPLKPSGLMDKPEMRAYVNYFQEHFNSNGDKDLRNTIKNDIAAIEKRGNN